VTVGIQFGLFEPRRRAPTYDEERLLARLRSIEESRRFHAVNGLPGFSPAALKRLSTPIPPITVPR
jgi:hypothetical protein